ncbi:sodium/potassium-transporting ATPase subunit beta-1-interacting protein 3-like isoform X1 [Tachypleus tridentatus]|uniref:sodium/potassium-transporting ATPase subunit beta-1-interacting protein 3-like isoform X1 n=1 Tax=Tachypleus tridentatus TaxID=6853 RepID=UPI003FD5EBA7
MSCCTIRSFFLTVCGLQFVTTVQRQVFDFLGYMWAPIIGNFFQMIAVILGIFGAYQLKRSYIILYLVWTCLWLGWNVFLICFYLDIGILNKDSSILNFGTGSRSWWESNGIGCKPIYNLTLAVKDPLFYMKPTVVEECSVEYSYVECLQAGIQCCLSIPGLLAAILALHCYKPDHRLSRRPSTDVVYSIQYQNQMGEAQPTSIHHQPLTPRKVKRRSTRSKRGSSQRRYYQNPVTKLLDIPLHSSSSDTFGSPSHSTSMYNSSASSSQANLLSSHSLTPLQPNGQAAPVGLTNPATVI